MKAEEVLVRTLGWAMDNISALAGSLIGQMTASDTTPECNEYDPLEFTNERLDLAVQRAKQAIFKCPERSSELSIRAVKVTIDELLRACGLDPSEIKPLDDYLLDYGMEGWPKFWEDEVEPRCPGSPFGRLDPDPWSNVNSYLLRAWLVKLGRPDPHPHSCHTSLADFDAGEVWIRAESIALLLDLSIDFLSN